MTPQEIIAYFLAIIVLGMAIEWVAYGYSRKADPASTRALLDAEQAAFDRYQRTARRRMPE